MEKDLDNIELKSELETSDAGDTSKPSPEENMVVADMSLVRRRRAFLPDRIRNEERLTKGGPVAEGGFSSETVPRDPRSQETISSVYGELTPDQTKWAILGTLKAALLVGSAYAVGLGGLILILFLLFRH